jgi:hypothetical protein
VVMSSTTRWIDPPPPPQDGPERLAVAEETLSPHDQVRRHAAGVPFAGELRAPVDVDGVRRVLLEVRGRFSPSKT